jgi:hypothetical protein
LKPKVPSVPGLSLDLRLPAKIVQQAALDLAGAALQMWDALAGVAEILPHPPLTRNQVELMQIDTTASDNLPGFHVLGISPRSLEEELEAILKQSK